MRKEQLYIDISSAYNLLNKFNFKGMETSLSAVKKDTVVVANPQSPLAGLSSIVYLNLGSLPEFNDQFQINKM